MKRFTGTTIRLLLFTAAITLAFSVRAANADFTFGTPILVPNVNSSSVELCQSISSDGLMFYFASNRPGGYGNADLWVSTRPTTEDEWAEPVNLGPPVNSSGHDYCPSISADGLTLYFADYWGYPPRPGGLGGCDIWETTRATTDGDWSEPVNLGAPINSSSHDLYPCISLDGLSLYFTSHRPGGHGADLWVSRRERTSGGWGEPINLGSPANSGMYDGKPAISADGRILVLTSDRIGGVGDWDLWMTQRATIQDDWSTPFPLSIGAGNAALSADGRTLYFYSDRPGGPGNGDLWQMAITPVVDFNSNGIVNAEDMCVIVDHWNESYSLCDIGPMPWGDGIVDAQDLIFLAEHLFEEIPLPLELTAYWRLDEEEGDITHDSAVENVGLLFGGPVWLPTEGERDGSLQFDGMDDYISTDFILDPGDGSFSVFAWINGGGPGQIIVSQADTLVDTNRGSKVVAGSTWLGLDASSGTLMTGLKQSPYHKLLVSQSVITDGQWHHIGLVQNASDSKRCLYTDGVEVASDSDPASTVSCKTGLYIGSGQSLDTTSFFSGLIDDVRIYSLALSPEKIEALAQ
ncbi:MAG: LamG-like jellyroll fold domain-containing protein [Planctomycetota bacterium]|jgi:Tol biopolymer transport system component